MHRVVLDTGVLVSGLISSTGAPAEAIDAARAGRFALVVSPHLLAELAGVLMRERFRRYLTLEDALEYVEGIAVLSESVADPADPPRIAADEDDDYLFALAQASGAVLVSGDRHVRGAAEASVAVLTPREFVDQLAGA